MRERERERVLITRVEYGDDENLWW